MEKKSRKFIQKFFVILVLLSATPAFAAVGSSCPDGILSYWKLDEPDSATAYVDAISGFNGSCNGGCPTALATDDSVVGRARSFGGGGGIFVPRQASFDWGADSSFSIELWVRRSPVGLDQEEVLMARTDGSLEWKISLLADGKVSFGLKDKNGLGPVAVVSQKILAEVLGVQRWHHVVAIRDGVNDKNLLYVDGVMEGSLAFDYSDGFYSDSAGITMGWIDAASQERFSGDLDEIAIYNRVLEEEEIRAHYFLSKGYCSLYDARVRIMPLGDSITADSDGDSNINDGNSYRKPLFQDLDASHYWFDFVGSLQNGDLDDKDHEGHPGYTDDQVADSVQSWLTSNPADVVLLHIGTNGFDTSPTDVSNILTNIDEFDGGNGKRITVVLAKIIDDIEEDPSHDLDVTTFNENIETMANARIAKGDKIIMVDMEKGAGIIYKDHDIYPEGDMINDLHPYLTGYAKMADQWFVKLNSFLPMFELPHITSTPIEKATRNKKYQYDVEATGQPQPKYRLLTGPSGMTIDENSGLLEWTPDASSQSGQTVKIEAYLPEDKGNLSWSNRSDVQEFTITLNTAPVARPESYGPVEGGKTLTATQWDGVLANDSDPDDGDHLSAILVSTVSHGTLELNQDGSFSYTHNGDDVTSDAFTYKANDGLDDSNIVTVTITINPVHSSATTSSGGGGCFINSAGGEKDFEFGPSVLAMALCWAGFSLLFRRIRKQ